MSEIQKQPDAASTQVDVANAAPVKSSALSTANVGTRNKLLVLAGVQAVLAAVTLAGGDGRAIAPEKPVLPGLEPSTLTAVTITQREKIDKPLTLARATGQWTLPDYFNFPLAGTEIETALTTLAQATAQSAIGIGPAAQTEMGVADDKWDTKLVFRGPAGDKTIYLGKMVGRGAAVRLAGQAEVFSAKGVMPHTWSPEFSTWHKVPYFDASKNGATRIAFAVGGHAYDFRKNGDKWDIIVDGKLMVYPKGFEQSKYGVGRVVTQASRIDMKEPGDPKAAPPLLLTVTVEEAAPKAEPDPMNPDATAVSQPAPAPTVYDVAKVEGGYWIKVRGKDTAVVVGETQLEALIKPDQMAWGKKELTAEEKAKQQPIEGIPGNLPEGFKPPTTLPWEE